MDGVPIKSLPITTAFAALGLLLFAEAAWSQTAPVEYGPPIQISGRLVDIGGKPVRSSVRMAEAEPDGLVNETTAETDSDGIFTFLAKSSKKYRIYLGGGYSAIKTPPKTVDTTSGEDVNIGSMVFEHCSAAASGIRLRAAPPAGRLESDQIVIEPQKVDAAPRTILLDVPHPPIDPASANRRVRVELPQCWAGPTLENREEWELLGYVTFAHPISLGAFVGGGVEKIRVIRYLPNLTPERIRQELLKVWASMFSEAGNGIFWSESSQGNIEASIEFENGGRGLIVTDGGHVRVQDRAGKSWFLRPLSQSLQ